MPDAARKTLFSTYDLNGLELKNRVVMASMTRGRARNQGLVPTELHVEYYRQRASAGLVLTESTWVSRASIGVINVPGLFTAEQTEGWRKVVEAVHGQGGRIYAEVAHSGAVSHPDFFDGKPPLAPSAVNPGVKSFTPTGFKDTVTPREMTVEQIEATIRDYAAAGRNAKQAGFDGVELHLGHDVPAPRVSQQRPESPAGPVRRQSRKARAHRRRDPRRARLGLGARPRRRQTQPRGRDGRLWSDRPDGGDL